METFDYDGSPIKYTREGKGDPIIMIHNGGTSHAIWRDVVPQISKSYEVFALDLLGFGASDKPASGYDLANYIGLLTAFIDAHQIKDVRLVGNCMGSAISLGFAMRRPNDVQSLVLVNPLTDATYSAGWLGSTLWLRKNAKGISHGIYGSLSRFHLPRWISKQSLAFQFGSVGRGRRLHHTPELCACFTGEGQMHSLTSVLDDLMNYSVFDRFEPGAGFPPVCTIWGLENRVLSAEAGRKLNATLRPAREEWLAGCGHLAMLEKPDEVASIIQEFFSSEASAQQKVRA